MTMTMTRLTDSINGMMDTSPGIGHNNSPFPILSNKKFGATVKSPFRPQVTSAEYPNCCAIELHRGFSGDYPRDHDRRSKLLDQEVKKMIQVAEQSGRGISTCVINNYQRDKGWNLALENNGYEQVAWATNPNHDNESSVYMYVLIMDHTEDGGIGECK